MPPRYRLTLLLSLSALLWPPSTPAAEALAPAPEPSADGVEFAFTLDKAGLTSAGVFDAEGRLVRTLWTMKQLAAGSQTGLWDGLDDFLAAAPAGDYRWRVVVNGSTYRNVGVIGNNGQPPDAAGHTPNNLQSVAVDAEGAVYTANGWDEAGADFKKWTAAGDSVYDARYQIRNGNPNGAPYSITVDDTYIYCGMEGWDSPQWQNRQQLQRFRLADGRHERFTEVARDDGHINVYDWPKNLIPPDAPEADAALMRYPLRAVAVQGETLLAADALGGRVLRYHKATGKPLGEFAVNLPNALAVDKAGRLWVGHQHTKVSVFTPDGKDGREVLNNIAEVESLAFGPTGRLYVADGGVGQVRLYEISGAEARLVQTFGQKARAGDSAPDRFYRLRGAAVDKAGNLFTINKMPIDGSILAKWSADGKLQWQRQGLEFVSLGNYGREDPDTFYSMTFHRYRLLDRAAGTWEFTGCLFPGGPSYRSDPHGTPRVLRFGAADFFFTPTGDGVQVWRIGERELQLAAAVGGKDPAWDGKNRHSPDFPRGEAGMWTWSDANANGRAEANEVRWLKKPGEQSPHKYATHGMDVDPDGNIWFPNHHTRGIWQIPRGPLDAHGNPTWDWTAAKEIVPRDASPFRFEPNMAQHADDGSIYAFGWSDKVPRPKNNPFWMGGNTLVRFDKNGQRLWAVAIPEAAVGLDAIPGGGCMVGMAQKANILHYTADGLLIGRLAPGEAMGKQSGWLDNQASVAVSRHPRDKLLDIFVEEDYALRIAWYRVDDRAVKVLTGTLKRP